MSEISAIDTLWQAAEPLFKPWTTGDPKTIRAEILDPNWDRGWQCHDWLNHVPDEVAKAWDQLSEDARIAVFIMASQLADSEEYE